MRWLVAVGCALSAATAFAGEHLFVTDGEPAKIHCGAAPPSWNRPELDDHDWNSRATIVERRDSGAPVEADPDAVDGGVPTCSGARFARWHFTSAPSSRR